MIKFFRKIRQNMLTENKFSKYILYAIGEILLVIIGILIALNNRNLVKQNEATFDALFGEILKDLIIDFKEADRILAFDARQDSLINRVLNNKVTEEDYKTEYGFIDLILSYEPMLFSDNGYNNLTRMIDKVPTKYNEVIDQLNTIHLVAKLKVIRPNEKLADLVFENLKKWANTKPWFYDSELINSEDINYFLTDPFYKNDVRLFQIYLKGNHMKSITMYKHLIAKSYISISKIIEPEKQIPELISSYIVEIPDNVL
jgi:hypothetical protein